MNRRGFLGLLCKCLAVGSALGVSPGLIASAEMKIAELSYRWVQVGGPPLDSPMPDGAVFAFELQISGEGYESWQEILDKINLPTSIKFVAKNETTLAS